MRGYLTLTNLEGILYLARSAKSSTQKFSSSKILPVFNFMQAQTPC